MSPSALGAVQLITDLRGVLVLRPHPFILPPRFSAVAEGRRRQRSQDGFDRHAETQQLVVSTRHPSDLESDWQAIARKSRGNAQPGRPKSRTRKRIPQDRGVRRSLTLRNGAGRKDRTIGVRLTIPRCQSIGVYVRSSCWKFLSENLIFTTPNRDGGFKFS